MSLSLAQLAEPPQFTAVDRLRLYTPEEVVAMKLLPHTVRTLKDCAYGRRIPHLKVAGKVCFRLDHILAIQQAGAVAAAKDSPRAA